MLMMDMAHISGLVAAEEQAQPFEYCDIVTTTTHKSLRGPRSGMIFFRRGVNAKTGKDYNYESRINMAVFPALQGGPHNHQIGALAVALKYAQTPEFKTYIKQVKANARALGETLVSKGYNLVTGGTDNHLVLWDLRPLGLTGSKMEYLCDLLHITLNKNAVFGDASALSPGGVRIGAPAMTSRGLVESDFVQIAEFLSRAADLCLEVQKSHGKMLKDWKKGLDNNPKVAAMRDEVEAFASAFEMPAFTKESIDI
jgi:glycine hydroxymethyltransferase